MPGLIAVSGRREPETVVRRAAQPLLRRPWQQLEVLSRPAEETALGFVGDWGGLASDEATGSVSVLYGELHVDGALRSGAGGARALLDLYVRDGTRLDVTDGWFNAAIWDPRARTLSLFSNRLGHPPLYVARSGSTVIAAGELKALVAAGVESRLDVQAWAELLAYEHALGERTPFAGIRLVPAASTLTVSSSGSESCRERWRYRVEPANDGEESKLVAEFARLLERAVANRVDRQTILALSGGLDSRCLATIVQRSASDTLAVTWGVRGSEDFELGTEVARRARLRHRQLPLEPGWIAHGAAETVWLAEGEVRCLHAHHLALRPIRSDCDARSLLISFGGDPIVRDPHLPTAGDGEAGFAAAVHRARAQCLTDELLEEVLAPGFAAELRGLASSSLARHLAEEEGDRASRGAQYIFRQNHRRKVWPGTALFSDDLVPRDPFDDAELIDFCRRLPMRLRAEGALECAYLRLFPLLASLPSPKDGLRPATTGWRRRAGARVVRIRRGSRQGVDRILGPRWWPNRRGLADYGTDLRLTGGDLLGILLEPRTLARRQLREQAVRGLIADTLAGRAGHTRLLGMLLTLELFQRQFLEGEAPTSEPG